MPGENKCYFAMIETEQGKSRFRGCTGQELPESTCSCLPDGGYICTSGYGVKCLTTKIYYSISFSLKLFDLSALNCTSLIVCNSNNCDAQDNLIIDKSMEDCPPQKNPEITTTGIATSTTEFDTKGSRGSTEKPKFAGP